MYINRYVNFNNGIENKYTIALSLLGKICHKELYPNRIELALQRQLFNLAEHLKQPVSSALEAVTSDANITPSHYCEQVYQLLPTEPGMSVGSDKRVRPERDDQNTGAFPWASVPVAASPMAAYQTGFNNFPERAQTDALAALSEQDSEKEAFLEYYKSFPVLYFTSQIKTKQELHTFRYIKPVTIASRLLMPLDKLTLLYDVLLREIIGRVWQEWVHLLCLHKKEECAYDLYNCYTALQRSFLRASQELEQYPKLYEAIPSKADKRMKNVRKSILSQNGYYSQKLPEEHTGYAGEVLRPWVFYQLRQLSLAALCAVYESLQELDKPLIFECFDYDDLFIRQLNQPVPAKPEELLFLNKMRGKPDDCCSLSECNHKPMNIKAAMDLYCDNTGLQISQKNLREKLNTLGFSYIEQNHQKRAVLECHVHYIAELHLKTYATGPK